jgi:hypothetical protein
VLLARFEDLWRARVDRLDALLAEPPAPPNDPSTDERTDTERD